MITGVRGQSGRVFRLWFRILCASGYLFGRHAPGVLENSISAGYRQSENRALAAGGRGDGKVTINSDRIGESFEKSVTFEVKGESQPKPVRFTLPIKRTVRRLSSALDSTMTATGKAGGS